MRATDAERENVRSILRAAHTEGRLTWDEFDRRSMAVLDAQAHDQLTALTSDLSGSMPGAHSPGFRGMPARAVPGMPAQAMPGMPVGPGRIGLLATGSQSGFAGRLLMRGISLLMAILLGPIALQKLRRGSNGMAPGRRRAHYVWLTIRVLVIAGFLAYYIIVRHTLIVHSSGPADP